MSGGLPDPSTSFGQRVLHRLRHEETIWITTVADDGTPQPNPVGFLFNEESSILIYNMVGAKRLQHIVTRPRVCLHFDGDGSGGNVVIFTGTASQEPHAPPPHKNQAFLDKYGASLLQISPHPEDFGRRFPIPLRVTITSTRGR